MAKPFLLVENLFSVAQFPQHSVSASSASAGGEPWRVATGRRSTRDAWVATVTGAEAWIRVSCGQARAANALVLDRGHGLSGRRIILEASANGFAGGDTVTVLDMVVPAAVVPGALATSATGAVTHEGAWIRRFPEVLRAHWRLRVPAAAGLRPSIVGLWLGRAWDPALHFDLPLSDSTRDLRFDETTSDAGWIGRGAAAAPRIGEIGLKLQANAEYSSAAEYHLEQGFWLGRPMWIVFDAAVPQRAVLAMPQRGRTGFERREGWTYPQAVVAWIEHEPALR